MTERKKKEALQDDFAQYLLTLRNLFDLGKKIEKKHGIICSPSTGMFRADGRTDCSVQCFCGIDNLAEAMGIKTETLDDNKYPIKYFIIDRIAVNQLGEPAEIRYKQAFEYRRKT